ncbi:MAG: DapH/DapD/GlmU-related protein [Halioglobus sp.]|nr:DapH/DapD/GlmU-related protein [Halioglobus sp.]
MNAARPPLVIYGAWYFSRVVSEAAEAMGWDVIGYVDPDPPGDVATLESVPLDAAVFIAIGDNAIRGEVSAALLARGRFLATIVHPAASISPSARLGRGSYAAELVAVRTNATLGEGVVLQAGSVVSHDCNIAPYASLGPNAAVASKVSVGQRTMVGVGAVIAPGLVLGDDCTVAAGAVVFKNGGAGQTLVGNPARATPSPSKNRIHSDWSAHNVW